MRLRVANLVPLLLGLVACSDASITVVYPDLAVTISEPAPGAVFFVGDPVQLRGTVFLGRAPLEGTRATWSIEGTDWTFQAEPDEESVIEATYEASQTGTLVAHLCVAHTDSPDDACDETLFTVVENTAPTVDVVLPLDGMVVDSETLVEFRGDADDDWDPGEVLGCRWTSSVEEELFGEGDCQVDPQGRIMSLARTMEPGLHTITLEVWDSRGEVGRDFAQLQVGECADADADGVSTCGGDCDDSDASVTDPPTWHADHDLDGHGRAGEWVIQCDQPPGHVGLGDDCDDDDPDNFPTNSEACDGADNDCNGLPDADVQLEADLDADGWRSCEECDDGEAAAFPGNAEVCDGLDNDCDGAVPADEVDADGDGYLACEECDDSDGLVFPGAPEICDGLVQDCDGTLPADEMDGDGDLQAPCAGDCDDADDANWLGNAEVCDDQDNDCDGDVDEGVPGGAADWYLDVDGDGFGDSAELVSGCAAPPGYVADGGDCDPSDPEIYPGAPELCDGMDNDCDGLVPADEVDGDGDGYIDAGTCGDDCDDDDPAVNPGAPEICNGIDDDCNGQYTLGDLDDDGDGHPSCADCDDTDATVYPGADELCDDQDNDCDGSLGADEVDDDADGYSDCEDDCDDSDPDINPGEYEVWDGVDQNCNDLVDDHVPFSEGEFCVEGVIEQSVGYGIFLGMIAGDLDGDGFGDLVVNGTDDSTTLADGLGEVAIFFGDGVPWTPGTVVSLSDADVTITGTVPGGAAATWSQAGDLDGDTIDDLVLTTIGASPPHTYVFFGRGQAEWMALSDADEADVELLGGGDRSHGPTGDMDGDGTDELILVSWPSGYFLVVFGRDATAWTALDGEDAADVAGIVSGGGDYRALTSPHASLAGDLDRDGFDDLVVGFKAWEADPDANASENTGMAAIWYGSSSADDLGTVDPESPDLKLIGGEPVGGFGRPFGSAGNLDQDVAGTSDLLVHGKSGPDEGLWLVPGSTTPLYGEVMVDDAPGAVFFPSEINFGPWGSMSTGHDVAGDALPDAFVYIASPPGESFVLTGPSTSWTPGTSIQELQTVGIMTSPPSGCSNDGHKFTGLDMTGDGKDEVVLGCHSWDNPVENAGMVCVFEGR